MAQIAAPFLGATMSGAADPDAEHHRFMGGSRDGHDFCWQNNMRANRQELRIKRRSWTPAQAVLKGIGYGILLRVEVLNDAGSLKDLVSERAG